MSQEENLSVERIIRIWDDRHGEHTYIGPDGDGLECVELREVDPHGVIGARFNLGSPKRAVLIAKSIIELYGEKLQ